MDAPLSGGAFQRRVRLLFARVPTLGGFGWDGAMAGIVREFSARVNENKDKVMDLVAGHFEQCTFLLTLNFDKHVMIQSIGS